MTVKLSDIAVLWEYVNALGGTAHTEYDVGYTTAITSVLLKIEELFKHVHVAGHPNDRCELCGFDFRHDIHARL